MKKFLVLSFSGQVGADEFLYGFVEAANENDAYERIEEENEIGYPGGFVVNHLVEITVENCERLEEIARQLREKYL